MKSTKAKKKSIENIISRIAIFGALQRNKIYNDNADTTSKRQFRDFLSAELKMIFKHILSESTENSYDHYITIENFSNSVSSNKLFKKILNNGRLNIGTAQKLINLHWKISWLLKPAIPTPVHCPFDRIIIKELDKSVRGINWTRITKIADYRKLVGAAEKAKGSEYDSIAEWELCRYGENGNYL